MSRRATQRPVSLKGGLQASLLLALLVLLAGTLLGELISGLLLGSLVFLAWRFGFVRQVLCHHLRNGMALAKAARHEDAMKAFARSAEAWQGRAWLDDLRGLLLGSASRWPFRHLSRYNEAWCMVKLGHEAEARVALDALLREQPGMRIARELRASLDPLPVAPPSPEAVQEESDWQDLLQDEPTLDPRELPEP